MRKCRFLKGVLFVSFFFIFFFVLPKQQPVQAKITCDVTIEYSCNPHDVTTCQACADPNGLTCISNNQVCSAGPPQVLCSCSTTIQYDCCPNNPPPGATPTPTPITASGCGQCNTCGITQWCNKLSNGQCVVDSCACGGVGCPTGAPSDPCPGDTCAGTCCNYGCGNACIVTADCKGASTGVQCMQTSSGRLCVNPICPNNSVPAGGGACGCNGGILCGNRCAGGCIAGSTCRFTDGAACSDPSNTYCIGDTGNNFNTYNSDYVTPLCSGGGNSFLQRVSTGQSNGFTLAQIQSTCQNATIQARAHVISPSDTSCAAINASTTYLTPTSFSLSPVVAPASQIQNSSSYVSWTNTVPAGTYTLSAAPPAGYVLQNSCWTRAPTAPASGQGAAIAVATTDTATFDLGFTLGTAWVQTQGGDVFAATTLKSLMTSAATPRLFNTNGTGGYPGLVSYGTSYNFNADPADLTFGANYTSSTNWLGNEPGDGGSKDPFKIDWYQYFLYQFDLSSATPDFTNPASPINKPASRATPYYVQGNMTTNGDWTVGAGENIIFVVNGNVTIGGKINITGSGFVAFIANGNITVANTVGVAAGSSVPVVEGMYITSSTGSFITGTSGAGTERFVGKGMFIAGTFLLQRDLSSVSANQTTSAELFLYNPQLLFTMPEKMKEVKVKWQEVAP